MRRNHTIWSFILPLLLLSWHSLKAEHIIGGEMYYSCTGPGQYAFTMKLYRDCNSTGANFDNPASFAIYRANGTLLQVIQTTVNTVQGINTSVASPCMVIPPNICVQEGIYNFNVTVPDTNQTYRVVYQRCCRNATILNLANPGAQGLTIESVIPPYAQVGCNSSPSFNNFPPPVLCAQELLEFDHSATDLDGDSLAYSLCSPFVGGSQNNPAPVPATPPPYNEVTWGPGYNALLPLQGNPGLTIDPVTGLLSGVPTMLGQYVIGVCVEEWRDGQLLSVNTRDFQFNVAFCEPPSQALVNNPESFFFCNNLGAAFTTNSAPSNNFFWDFGDPDSPNPTSTQMNPFHTFSDTGFYQVTLITNPGFFCSDTATVVVPVFLAAEVNANLTEVVCVEGQQTFSFQATGVFEDTDVINWDFGPNATPNTATGAVVTGIVFNGVGTQNVLTTLNSNACPTSDEISVEVQAQVSLSMDPQTDFCSGYTYAFSQQSQNVTYYIWNFGTEQDDAISTLPNPVHTFPEDGLYTVTLTAGGQGNCPVTVEEVFDIKSLLQPNVPSFPILCFDEHNITFEAEGSFRPDAEFNWTFENAVVPTSTAATVNGVIFLEPGTHNYSLTVSENGCSRSAEGSLTLHVNPNASFRAEPVSGCAPLTVAFFNESSTMSTNARFTWHLGDGSAPRSFVSTHTYAEPGLYSVELELENLNGCLGYDAIERTNYIQVLPTPQPGFDMSPEVLSVYDPVIELNDASQGGSNVVYFFDNQEFQGPDVVHELQNLVPQTITQRVSNGAGCSIDFERNIRISDHIIYVPNAFSPNGDGLNDIFEPVLTGATRYDMYIYDRWGNTVFAAEDVQRGWDGNGGNTTHYAPAGMYAYHIVVSDYSGWLFDYKGHVSLLR